MKDDPKVTDFYNKLETIYEECKKQIPIKENGEIKTDIIYFISKDFFKRRNRINV